MKVRVSSLSTSFKHSLIRSLLLAGTFRALLCAIEIQDIELKDVIPAVHSMVVA